MYTTKLSDGALLELETVDEVFYPTYTSQLFINAAPLVLRRVSQVLDLGCGCGVVGIALARMGLVSPPLYAFDVSSDAMTLAARNAARHCIAFDGQCGSLFEPWEGFRFDCVVDDVSGVAEDVARLSPWFADRVPRDSGPDGAALTTRVLDEAGEYLTEDGVLLFPVISLSDTGKILELARRRVRSVEKVVAGSCRLPPEMGAHLDVITKIRAEGRIHFEQKLGMVVCWTAVYLCQDPEVR